MAGKSINNLNLSCNQTKKEIFDFADRIYNEAYKLEKYDGASKFSDILSEAHRKYDLLRVLLLTESNSLKNRCKLDYFNAVYVYQYKPESDEVQAKQVVFARLLEKLKEKHPNQILLIPMAGNLNLTSVDVILNSHKVSEVPVILIDGIKPIYNITYYEDLEKAIFKSNNN
jgi:hypothetical protein